MSLSTTGSAFEGSFNLSGPYVATRYCNESVLSFASSGLSVDSRSADFRGKAKSGGNVAAAKIVGELVAQKAKASGIGQVVFDRGGYKYHGRVKALAEGAREGGLTF